MLDFASPLSTLLWIKISFLAQISLHSFLFVKACITTKLVSARSFEKLYSLGSVRSLHLVRFDSGPHISLHTDRYIYTLHLAFWRRKRADVLYNQGIPTTFP